MNIVKNFTTIHFRLDRCVGSYDVDVSVRNVMYAKKIVFGILLHEIVKMGNI